MEPVRQRGPPGRTPQWATDWAQPGGAGKTVRHLDTGPVAYGLETGIWTSPLVRYIIEEEFGLRYHAGHVRKLLRQLGYSMQRPTTRLVQADAEQHRKWVRYTYPNLKKTPKAKGR